MAAAARNDCGFNVQINQTNLEQFAENIAKQSLRAVPTQSAKSGDDRDDEIGIIMASNCINFWWVLK